MVSDEQQFELGEPLTAATTVPSGVEETVDLAQHVDALLPLVAPEQTRRLPQSTYRVQLNHNCPFATIEQAVPYLAKLGITDFYASPFLKSRPGSVHGYDIVDHRQINPEIGTREELHALSASLRAHQMGLIADLVPNHMCADPVLNFWWQDVLENGPSSIYASYFDIDWMPLKPDLAHKVLLPVLGDQFGKVLEDGELQVCYEDGCFWLDYFEHRFPLSPRSYAVVLAPHLDRLEQQLGTDAEELLELLSILTAIKNLPDRAETLPTRLKERRREKEVIKRRLRALTTQSPPIAEHVQLNLQEVNGIAGDSASFELLDQLLDEQAYRLSYWRTATDEINYRRFFDINELAAIRTEHADVFQATHELILELLAENTITGLRIDHPDGLYDPQGYMYHLQREYYLQRCRSAIANYVRQQGLSPAIDVALVESRLLELWEAAARIPGSPVARPLYVVAEKILAIHEDLPQDWPIHGTVGYDFLNMANGLFVVPANERELTNTYARFSGEALNFEELAYLCKRLIVRMSMASEINVLGHQLDRISERNRWTRDFTLTSQTRALQEVVAGFNIYRTYVRPHQVLERDRNFIQNAVAQAKRRNPAMNASVFDFVQDVLLLKYHDRSDAEERSAIEQFVGKFQQVTGPIMAKAVEDTAFYRFNRLISLNEVGGEPAHFGTTVAEFHGYNMSRLPWQSHSMNATSTHDTKRSEDVRARIHVLSEIPKLWREHLQRWARQHRPLKTLVEGSEAPDSGLEYLLYQSLIGLWPDKIPTGEARQQFVARIVRYMLKVAREAKVHTSWISPVEPYEQAIERFVDALFSGEQQSTFLEDMQAFASRVAEHGRWNSLSQLALKLACPGVADIYQGCETWNLTLVDPDNRQPIDYNQLDSQLQGLFVSMKDLQSRSPRVDGGDPQTATNRNAAENWVATLKAGDDSPETLSAISNWLRELLEQRADGRIKLLLTTLGLHLRRSSGDLYPSGQYIPLNVIGPLADHVIAFARQSDRDRAVIVVPRWTVGVTGFGSQPPLGDVWRETCLQLPTEWPGAKLRNIFTRAPLVDDTSELHEVPISRVLQDWPVGWFVGEI